MGLNVAIEPDEFPAELRWPATSLGTGGSVDAVLEALTAAGRWVAAPDETLTAYRSRDVLRDRAVGWVGKEGEGGVARGIDERGNLVVETEQGERLALGSGEVSLRVGGDA